jgi:hypothetical protein
MKKIKQPSVQSVRNIQRSEENFEVKVLIFWRERRKGKEENGANSSYPCCFHDSMKTFQRVALGSLWNSRFGLLLHRKQGEKKITAYFSIWSSMNPSKPHNFGVNFFHGHRINS